MFLNFSCHKTTEENCQHLSFGIARKINPVSSPFKVSLESYPLITEGSLATQSATVSSQTLGTPQQTSLNTISCWLVKLSNYELHIWNLLFSSCLATSFACTSTAILVSLQTLRLIFNNDKYTDNNYLH